MIQELGDIDPLATLPNLKMLSLLQNPVAHQQHYRPYVVYKLPQLKVLDFKKIKLKVSLMAVEFYRKRNQMVIIIIFFCRKRKKQKQCSRVKKAKNFKKPLSKNLNLFQVKVYLNIGNLRVRETPIFLLNYSIFRTCVCSNIHFFLAQRAEEIKKIREVISKASSLEEVERLNQLLQAGQIPGETKNQNSNHGNENLINEIFFFSQYVNHIKNYVISVLCSWMVCSITELRVLITCWLLYSLIILLLL